MPTQPWSLILPSRNGFAANGRHAMAAFRAFAAGLRSHLGCGSPA